VPRFIERIRALLNGYGDRFTVAEVGGEGAEADMKLYTEGEARFHTAYGFNFLYADELTPASGSRLVGGVAARGRHGVAELGILQSRCAARGDSRGSRRPFAPPARGSRCCCS
jgi:hypothetical protein